MRIPRFWGKGMTQKASIPTPQKPSSASMQMVAVEASKMASISTAQKLKAVGSCSDRVISSAELKKLDGHYLKVAETLLGEHPIRIGRVVATTVDLAIFLMLLRWFTGHMNADGSLPWARFHGLWTALYEAKDISRAFEPKRFAALRNYISSLGLIDWQDNKYHPECWCRGEELRGKACKWKASERLMAMLQEEVVQVQEKEEEKREEEKIPLTGTNSPSPLLKLIQSLNMLPWEETIRPIWAFPLDFEMPSEAELAKAMGRAA